MSRSHPSIHPVDLAAAPSTAPPGEENIYPPMRLRMKDIQGMPGTSISLVLRAFQFLFAAISLSVMASTSDFPSVTAFRYRLSFRLINIFFRSRHNRYSVFLVLVIGELLKFSVLRILIIFCFVVCVLCLFCSM